MLSNKTCCFLHIILLNMHVELHDMLFQMHQIACWVTCMLNNMKFSMLVNMHVSDRVLAKYCLLHDLQYCNTFLSEILHLQYFFIIALKYYNFSFAIFLKFFLKFLMNLSEIQCHNLQIQLLRSKLFMQKYYNHFSKIPYATCYAKLLSKLGFKMSFFDYRKILQK